MALTGLEIYKLLPKTNCKKCGFPTCLAFAMALAAKKVSLDKCPDVSEETKKILAEASEPPIRTILIDNKYKIGGETVLFRHEKTFYNPCLIGVLIKDTFDEGVIDERINSFDKLEFERIGQKYRTEFLVIKSESGDKEKVIRILNKIKDNIPVAFLSYNVNTLSDILKIRKLSVIGVLERPEDIDDFVSLARQYSVPLVVGGDNLDKIIEIIDTIVKKHNYRELIINISIKNYLQVVEYLTQIRRIALKRNFRNLGYPVSLILENEQEIENLCYATLGILKYASIVVVNTVRPEIHLALVTLRLNIYTDPQKPTTVEPKVYQIGGKPTGDSPLMVTTNFSLTYYSVEPEILNSKIPSWLLVVDTDGLSVLTAWAAEKFVPEKVVEAMKKEGVMEKLKTKKIIIPGYVAVMSGKLNELLPDWEVIVGPKEASGIPKFLKTFYS
ncbi:MAG: acetyl-CoA decarbonylase/synthase complex subunit gamma [Endomicrobia bacterium]|nr:acetyl-CoA decarbonylase/synthase complex subunit gamma [Endomicrobiia bacterium]